MKGGPVCQHAAQHVAGNGIEVGFARQSTGARWTLSSCIELSLDLYPSRTETDLANPIWLLPLRPNFLTRLVESFLGIAFRNAFRKGDRA